MPLAGRPLVEWSIAAFREASSVHSIVVACPPGHVHGLDGEKVKVVDGGATRSESVSNALRAVDTELVAIHDAARPLVTAELIEAVTATLTSDPEAAGAIAATPLTDTVKQATSAALTVNNTANAAPIIEQTLNREWLWAAQTPQVFRVAALRAALAGAEDAAAATDEASLIEAGGGRVLIHPSSPENLKVTTSLDLHLAELLLADRAGAAPGAG